MRNHDTTKGTIAWFARNPVAANLLLLVLIIGGTFSAFTISKEAEPAFRLKVIRISVPYPGASPLEVERGINIKIEEAIEGLEGIEEIRSEAREGVGTITARVEASYSISEVMDEVSLRVGSIFTFPENAERPIISRIRTQDDIIDVQVYGNIDERQMTEIAQQVREELAALPEISLVELNDTRAFEISIEISEDTLKHYNLTLAQVAQRVRASSVDLPGGTIRTDNADIRLRTDGKVYTGNEFSEITLIKTPDGARVTLGDVANIRDGFVENRRFATFNGQPSLSLSVFSVGDQSEIAIARAVREYVAQKQAELPDGIYISTWADGSHYLKGRLNMMMGNLALGATLVFLMLGLFLRLNVAFWVVIGIPVCFLGTLWLMPLFDVSVNMISLFGFILVLGILVDDAIVIGENVYSNVEEHGPTVDNVISGAQQVALPATFGVLTTIAAFIPMTMISGPSGPLWKSVGMVVILALVFSLIESKWILPAHLMSLAKRRTKPRKPTPLTRLQDGLEAKLKWLIRRVYEPILNKALQHRYTTLSLFIGALMISVGAVTGGIVRFVFFPDNPSDYISASVEMKAGTSFESLRGTVRELETALEELDQEMLDETGYPLVKHTRSWLSDRRNGFIFIELNPSENRSIDSKQIARLWSEKVGEVPGAESVDISGSFGDGGADIGLSLESENMDDLAAVATLVENKLREYAGVYNVKSDLSDGPPEAILEVKPEAEALGLTLADIAAQARYGFYGFEVQRLQRGEDEVKVMVRYPEEERRSMHDLESMYFRTVDGRSMPFASVADVEMRTGFTSIRRFDGKRSTEITATADKTIAEPGRIVGEVRQYFEERIQPRYPTVGYRLTGQSEEGEESLFELFVGLGFALFAIYALMAIPLKSYTQPLFIMAVIPFGFIGALVGHFILGLPISILSMCGLIALAGVVVNDSLVMVDFVNQGKARGLNVRDAARAAGVRRFRAILLTSLTTFIGLIPIISETSMQAQMVIPMAVTLAFGILFSTIVTLILIPSLYLVADDLGTALRGRKEKRFAKLAETTAETKPA